MERMTRLQKFTRPGAFSQVKRHVSHPCYTPSPDQDHDDVALLELASDPGLPPDYYANVDGINGSVPITEGMDVILAGYGITSNYGSGGAVTRMAVTVPMRTAQECIAANPNDIRKG